MCNIWRHKQDCKSKWDGLFQQLCVYSSLTALQRPPNSLLYIYIYIYTTFFIFTNSSIYTTVTVYVHTCTDSLHLYL